MVGSLVDEQEASDRARSAAQTALRRPVAGRVPEINRFPCIGAAGSHPAACPDIGYRPDRIPSFRR